MPLSYTQLSLDQCRYGKVDLLLHICCRARLQSQDEEAAEQHARMVEGLKSVQAQELAAVRFELSQVEAREQAHAALAAQRQAEVGMMTR